MNDLSYEAQILHAPYAKEDAHKSLSMPVYHSVAYEFDTAEAMEDAFCGRTSDHTYSRITNPTVEYFESRVKSVTGAINATALNSGMAAISNALLACVYAGGNVVTSPHLFGNTYVLFKSTLAGLGVEPRFCDLTNMEEVGKNMDENTCAVFLEIISNPQMEVVDLRALSSLCRKRRIPMMADTTIVPFTVFAAKDFGVDIEIISSTKYISGGATSTGGLIVDYGTFDWSVNKALKSWCAQSPFEAFNTRLRREIHRNMGAYMTPQAACMQTLGLETLNIRFCHQAKNALLLAERLQGMDGIVSVNYNGLRNNPFHDIAVAQFGAYPGAMLTFDMASRSACFSMLNRLRLIHRATNLFDNRSLAIHPASTIYGSFTEDMRQGMDVHQETIRLSVGLESVDDLAEDIRQAAG